MLRKKKRGKTDLPLRNFAGNASCMIITERDIESKNQLTLNDALRLENNKYGKSFLKSSLVKMKIVLKNKGCLNTSC